MRAGEREDGDDSLPQRERDAPLDLGVWAAVAVGGGLGTALRLAVDAALPVPWGLLAVNVLGAAALLALVLGVWPRSPCAPRWLRDGLGTGLLGAFTTLSGVSLWLTAAGAPHLALDALLPIAGWAVLAGAGGTLLRLGAVVATRAIRFPLGVLVVNALGSLLAGLAVAAWARGELGAAAVLIIVGGACGGLTTFSTIVLDAVRAWAERRRWSAALILAANLGLGSLAAWLGLLA